MHVDGVGLVSKLGKKLRITITIFQRAGSQECDLESDGCAALTLDFLAVTFVEFLRTGGT